MSIKRWYFGYELLQIADWKPFELLNHIKNGLTPYDETGRPVLDRDTLPRHKKSLEEITKEMEQKFINCDPPRVPTGIIERIFKNQEGTPVFPQDGSTVMSFSLPANKSEAVRVFEQIKQFQFKGEDVSNFIAEDALNPNYIVDKAYSRYEKETEESINYKPILSPATQTEPAAENKSEGQIDTEGFIRSMAISYLSDNEVIIKIDKQKPKTFTRKDMGFEKSKKTWPLFLTMLRKGDFNTGIYDKNKNAVNQQNYNRLAKFPANFSKKFIAFLNKEFSLSLDSGVNIFQNMKGIDRAGTYKPKFQILKNMTHDQQQDINSLSKKETSKMIERLSQERKKAKGEGEKDRLLSLIGDYAEHAKKNGWLTEEQLENYLSSPDDESSEYDAMSLTDDKYSLSIIKE